MEGLKLIAQSTFDRHQKFRTAGDGQTPYRYNVIEIGAFGAPAPQYASVASPTSTSASGAASGSKTVSKRQSVGSLQQQKSTSGSVGATHLDGSGMSRAGGTSATTKRVTLNEWMVHEDDLVAFMKKRPVEIVASTDRTEKTQQPQSGSVTTSSTGNLSKTFSSPSGSKLTENTSTATNDNNRTTTTTTTTTKRDRGSRTDEIEAVASLKLICIPRADPDLSNSATSGISGDFPSEGGAHTLGISREAFLRLYVDQMDADHCALYYLSREYDGFHEFNDHSRGIVTKFVGTSDYALIWTFNRRTLETKGLFLDRYHRSQLSDSLPPPSTSHNGVQSGFGSAPVTPSNKSIRQESSSVTTTPSKRWTKRQTGTVSSSVAWQGFRDTLKMYRKYVYAPQLLSFVASVHMLRAFDDEVNDEDLPSLRSIEANLGAFQQQHLQQHRDGSQGSDHGDDMLHNRFGGFMRTQSSSFAYVSQPQQPQSQPSDPFANAPKTPPPPPQGDYTNNHDMNNHSEDRNFTTPTHNLPSLPQLLDTEKLAFQARATNRVDTSLANKLRHLKTARTILELLARDHETVIVGVVAPAFLDRYHWTMEGMTEAIPALERHIGSLEEYLGYLKGRAERLTGLVRSLTAFATYRATAFAPASSISAVPHHAAGAGAASRHYSANGYNNASASSLSLVSDLRNSDFPAKSRSQFQSSDAFGFRCNNGADSQSDFLGGLLLGPKDKQLQQQQQQQQRPARPRPQRSTTSRSSVLLSTSLGPSNALGILRSRPRRPDDFDKTPTTTAATTTPLSPPTLPGLTNHHHPASSSCTDLLATTARQQQQQQQQQRSRRPSSSTTTTSLSTATSHHSTLTRTTEQSRSSNRGFYASYLLRGNYSHRLT